MAFYLYPHSWIIYSCPMLICCVARWGAGRKEEAASARGPGGPRAGPPPSTELLLQCQLDRRQAMREVQVRCCCEHLHPKQEEIEQYSDLDFKVEESIKVRVINECDSYVGWILRFMWDVGGDCYSCGLEIVENMVCQWPASDLTGKGKLNSSTFTK